MAIDYEELIAQLDELCHLYNAFSIGIDGMAFAGKTTLATHLAKKYGAPVIHMDDFLLPVSERPADWVTTPGAEMDFERFREEICEPWMQRKPIAYSLRDEKTGEYTERVVLPDAQMYIIEGTYSMHPGVLDFYDLHLFYKLPDTLQAKRAQDAGVALLDETRARHNLYFVTYMTELTCDEVLDETLTLPPDDVKESQKTNTLDE